MNPSTTLFAVLAAGEGTRMRSAQPKVMHAVAGEPMIGHVLATAREAVPDSAVCVVIGPGMESVERFVTARDPKARTYVQTERLGTAHATLAAREALSEGYDEVVVLYGDTPLIKPRTLNRLRDVLRSGADAAVLGFEPDDPAGYGRLITRGERLVAIREERDASEAERAIGLCNSGVIAFRGALMPDILDEIGNDNAKGEFYLTDAIAIANARGLTCVAVAGDADEVLGVNSRLQLAEAEAALQARLRAAAMDGGATLVAPETVFLSRDTRLGRDVVVEPNVMFGPGVTVGDGSTIRAFCHLEGARLAGGVTIGPYARLRPGAELGDNVRIGNFVEVKAATFGTGAKANHLAYVGDASVGAGANVGAGTITCNYDGVAKHRTEIGAGAFIGSNSSLVAPLRIGEGAYVASGSVLTRDVSDGALAVGRARQVEKTGWVSAFRARLAALKGQSEAAS